LLLTLPKNKRGPSYVRWVIQRFCTKAHEVKVVNEKRSKLGPTRQFPWCWLCDDNLLFFVRLVSLRKSHEPKTAAVVKKREWGDNTPMFWQAMVAVQQHPNMQKFALSGFLRDDGTATCKTHDWKYDVMSLYKAVLLNNRELKRLGVEYLPGLQKYEDIYFNSAIQRQGGQMLKCQCYCYRANQISGAHKTRKRKLRDMPSDLVPGLIDTPHFHALGPQERQAVKRLSDWAMQQENHRKAKRERSAALKGSSKRATDPQQEQEIVDAKEDTATESDSSSSSNSSSHKRHRQEAKADPASTPAPIPAPMQTPPDGEGSDQATMAL